jgi:hypothetical protein
MASIIILIGTPDGLRHVAAFSEREAALKAESVIAALARTALPAPVSVQCSDFRLIGRLVRYLADLQMEFMSEEPV